MLHLHFFRNDFHPTALKNALVKIISFLTRHGLEGNSLEQGEEGAIFSICRPCPPLLVVVTLLFWVIVTLLSSWTPLSCHHLTLSAHFPPSLSTASGSHPRAIFPI